MLKNVKVTDLMLSDDVEHSGVKGMRWGVRRYQNEDGSLTEEGKARYGAQINKIKKQTGVSDEVATNVVLEDEYNKYVSNEQKNATDIANGTGATLKGIGRMIQDSDSGDTVIRGSYPDMTDEELQKRINRINLEQRYSDLTGDTKKIESGKKKAGKALSVTGEVVQTLGGIAALVISIRAISGKPIVRKKKTGTGLIKK